MFDNINVDAMIARQAEDTKRILAEVPEREIYDDTCYHGIEPIVSFTRMTSCKIDNEVRVCLFRLISNVVVKVVFATDVKVIDILPYFDLTDDKFILCSR